MPHLYDEDNGMLNQLTRKTYHGSQVTRQAYSFDYDAWGNTTSIHVWKPTGDADTTPGSATQLSAYTYDSAGKMTSMEYPSGQYVRYGYDSLDRLVSEKYYSSDNAVQAEYQYIYSADGQLARQQVIRNGAVTESYSFEYDSLGRLIRSREEGGSGIVQRTEHLYDTANRLTNQNWKVGDRNFKEIYKYNSDDGTMASMEIKYDCGNSGWGYVTDKLSYSYDALNRLTKVLNSENATQLYTRNYQYQDLSGSRTTSRLAQFDYRKPNDGPIIYGNSYEYDKNGNITQIKEVFTVGSTEKSRVLAKYEYDKLNQMTKETRYTYSGTSTTAASTTVVSYDLDMAGNLYAVTENGSVKLAYAYGDPTWADKLTAVTVNGTTRTIQYADALNPANWYNGTDYTDLTWTQGRRLSSITKGSQTYSYEYDMSGVRSVKIADGLKHEYVTQNGHVVRDTVTNAGTGAFQYMLDFTYDESGHPLTMRRYKNEAQTSYNTYHYVVNGQGDVVKLLHGTNTTVAEYSYDAYGNVLTKSGSLADLNPLRYRGYYCDTETGFYYLQSRYYDPAVRRFINADSYTSTGQGFLGYNMFAYCNNNPANGDDPTGYSMDWPREAYCSGAPGAGDSCGGGGDGIAAVIIILIGIFIVAHESAYAEIPSYAIPQSEAQIIALSSSNSKPNRPSIRKVTLDMEHILSGHSSGGNRGPNKDRFPSWMTPALIEKAIRFAYENAEKAGSMQYSWPKNGLGEVCKQFFIGHWGGMEIHFWFNYTMKIIETAWPK